MTDYREQAIRDVAREFEMLPHFVKNSLRGEIRHNRNGYKNGMHNVAYAVSQRARVLELEAELALQKGMVRAQDNREREAAKRLDMVHNCDWPDEVAERVLELKSREAELLRAVSSGNEAVLDLKTRIGELEAQYHPRCRKTILSDALGRIYGCSKLRDHEGACETAEERRRRG